MVPKYIFVFLMIGLAVAQEKDINDALANLPEDLQGKINATQITEMQEASKKAFREKCEKNGGSEAYPTAEEAFTHFNSCLSNLVDTEKLQAEINAAKPEGKVDEVFKRYCGRSVDFKGCFRNMTEAVKPCLSNSEKDNLKTLYNVTEQLAEFVCFKEGDRIALFIAEGGPDCFQSKRDDIQQCFNQTIGENYKFTTDISFNSLPELKFGSKECDQMTELQRCVVGKLETCEQPTSANIVDSLFKFIRKATPCNDFTMTKHEKHSHNMLDDVKPKIGATVQPNSASGIIITAATVLMAGLAALLV